MAKQITKPNGTRLEFYGRIAESGYLAPDALTYEQWDDDGRTLSHIEHATQWAWGDWLNVGEEQFGEMYAQAEAITAASQGTLRNLKWVASRMPPARRFRALTFAHHQAVASLEPAAADRLLALSEEHGWSVAQLREQIATMNALSNGDPNPAQDEQDHSILQAAKAISRARAERRRKERIGRIQGETGTPEFPVGRFPIIYADPPWRYESPPMGDTDRSIENHYRTMSLPEILALPVQSLAYDDAVLFMWATAPQLVACMMAVEAWGFQYRTQMVWIKDRIGMGHYVRNKHELLLIAKRGNPPMPQPANRPASAVVADLGEHSEKPEEFRYLIDAMYPTLAKIELFAADPTRANPPAGWALWGLGHEHRQAAE